MKLVVGLGNPGEEYARTRHNVGYLVADRLAVLARARFTAQKFAAELAEARLGPERVWIMKPQTYMNASGEAVGAALRFWKLDLEDLVVVHDDLELEPFRVQLKVGGGHGGHNGIKSVNAHAGGPDYARVRIGVGRPPPVMDPADYVLGRFSRADEAQLEEALERATEAARLAVELGAAKAMNQVNRRASKAAASPEEKN
jgi:PTH1 family peptidyl-tRNA hydrolase